MSSNLPPVVDFPASHCVTMDGSQYCFPVYVKMPLKSVEEWSNGHMVVKSFMKFSPLTGMEKIVLVAEERDFV